MFKFVVSACVVNGHSLSIRELASVNDSAQRPNAEKRAIESVMSIGQKSLKTGIIIGAVGAWKKHVNGEKPILAGEHANCWLRDYGQ
jgi:hypothetical protein